MHCAQFAAHEPCYRVEPVEDDEQLGEYQVEAMAVADMDKFMLDDETVVGIGGRYDEITSPAER